MSEDELLPSDFLEEGERAKDQGYRKGSDILDIWLDSGLSWLNVLPEPQVSDLCIEGVDQIRGWFQSSLLTSIALRGISPYRNLFIHGFTTDADGCKMSKSKGNVISPCDITDGVEIIHDAKKKSKSAAMGIDVLRWWVAGHACQHDDIPVKYESMKECFEQVSKLRNVLKFLLGSLNHFDYCRNKVSPNDMQPLDVYMLHLLTEFYGKVDNAYDSLSYKQVARVILSFVSNEVSSFYFQLIKDRLYCEKQDSLLRRSCQTVLHITFDILSRSLAPVLPHLAEEGFLHHPNKTLAQVGVFRRDWNDVLKDFQKVHYPESIKWALNVRNTLLKNEIQIRNVDAVISCSEEIFGHLKVFQCEEKSNNSSLCELLQVLSVTLTRNMTTAELENASYVLQGSISCDNGGCSDDDYTIALFKSEKDICPRCKRYTSENSLGLCLRCDSVIRSIGSH